MSVPPPSPPSNRIARDELARRATGSVKWSVLGSVAPRLITPLATVALTLLLTPADFGVVAASMTIVALAQIVLGLGLGEAVVQRRTDVDRVASTAFWMSVAFGAGLYALLFALAPSISRFYRMPVVTGVARVAGTTLLLSALASIPNALMRRHLEFRKLFFVNAVGPVATGLSSVGLALAHLGLWALVLGQVVGVACSTVLSLALASWRPARVFDPKLVRSLTSFGMWVVVTGLMTWCSLYADSAIAGRYFGAEPLGVYSLAMNVSGLLPMLVVAPLVAIAYPTFCSVDGGPKEVGRLLVKVQSVVAVGLFPVALGLSSIAGPGKALLYGASWPRLEVVIQLLAILPGMNQLWALDMEAYRAIGRPDVWAKIFMITVLVVLPLLFLAAPHGLVAFAWARCLGSIVMPALAVFVAPRLLDVPILSHLRTIAVPFGCAVAMAVVVRVLGHRMAPFAGGAGWLKLAVLLLVGVSSYFGLLRWLHRPLWNDFWAYSRRALFGEAR